MSSVISKNSTQRDDYSRMKKPLRLAMLGLIPGNGHPYSWSAIINGYNPSEMAKCSYTLIPQYLDAQPLESVRIPEAQVTHIWTDDPAEAPLVASATLIPNVVFRAEDVIGEVDAVIIATDDGSDHARRARPFVEAGLPVFVDKPLATTREDLRQFAEWRRQGARILSSSGMRYAVELNQLENQDWLWLTSLTCKTWERYGIHALEPVFRLLGSGFSEVRSESREGSDIVYCKHKSGTQVTLAAIHDAYGCFGSIHGYGRERECSIRIRDTYSAFRNHLLTVVKWLQSGSDPHPFFDTLEMMSILIAAQESRRQGKLMRVESILEDICR